MGGPEDIRGSGPQADPAAPPAPMNNPYGRADVRTIDTNLYSRQIGAFGLETMGKLIRMKILVSGMTGAGVEAAKNIILAGPHAVALHDNTPSKIADLGSNFYITETDVAQGRTRAEACRAKLAELNDYVLIQHVTSELTDDVLSQYDVIIVSDIPRSEMIRINRFCRSQQSPIGFIAMDGFGLAGCIFVDFGREFTVFDKDGNPLKSALVENIQQDVVGKVTVHPDKPCPFETGDYVIFREVKGMTEINNTAEPFRVTRENKCSFTISDTSKFSAYERDGIVEERKMPMKLEFESLEHCIKYPVASNEDGLLVPDFGKFGRSEQLHFAIQSVYAYREAHGTLPPPRSAEAVQECLNIAIRLNEEAKERKQQNTGIEQWRAVSVDEVDAKVVENVVKFAACHISPIASVLGGVVAQEVVKYTGKFLPLRQWFYYDAFEVVPPLEQPLNEEEVMAKNSRYDHQLCIWGETFQKRLGALQLFVVGAGALGCEYIKSLSLMGCCTAADGGCATITDMDRIEISNLNRQFLFRRQHIGASKSTTAATAGKQMNPDFVALPCEMRVGPETENTFNDSFWEKMDLVINALDNIQSRLYVDGRCVWYHKPLLESGTLGTKGNVQVVLPHLTQSYGDSKDPPEESIPLCTLRHFPNQIEHTIEWARDAFQGLFCDAPQEAQMFLNDAEQFLQRLRTEGTSATQRSRLEKIATILRLLYEGVTFEKCVDHVVGLFTSYFDHQIAQLLHTFPLDHVTSDGQPFWSGPKRPPQPIQFSADNPLHLSFLQAAANLWASNFGMEPVRDLEAVRRYAQAVSITPFVPKQTFIKTHDKDSVVEGLGDDEFAIQTLQQELLSIATSLVNSGMQNRINPVEFDKDDDTNFHLDFIWACANLRALNYKIPECDRYKAQMIAGKIIPAIATTTAAITGLASLEFLKMVTYQQRKLEDFKNAFVNLGLPLFVLSEPLPPLQTKSVDYDPVAAGPVKAKPEGFTTWDILEIRIGPNETVRELLDKIGSVNEVQVCILSVGNACLYNGYLKSHEERLESPVKQLVERITKTKLPPGKTCFSMEASCSDNDGADVIIPTLKIVFKE